MSKKSKASDIQESLLLDLPSEIIMNILSRLPVLSIISCKYVCKEFLQIISTPEFAKFHLSVSIPGLIVGQQREDLFKLLEYEDMLKLQSHDLRDLEVMKFVPDTVIATHNFRSRIRGSVNGLLCLVPSTTYLSSVYICNPIMREYIHIPMPKHSNKAPYYFHRCGFGVSGLSGQYKVIVNYCNASLNECLIYTLGTTGSWRSIAPDAFTEMDNHQYTGQFLSGNLHWLVEDDDSVPLISCFDLETELFKYFPSPPISSNFAFAGSLAVLEEFLCLCDMNSDDENVILWVMTEYGVEKSWTRKLAISHNLLEECSRTVFCETIFPIAAFADGGFLYTWDNMVLFYYCNKTKTTRLIEAFQEDGRFEKIIHTLSFLSLKSFGVESVISF